MDQNTQLEALLRELMSKSYMSDAERSIGQNQQFNQDAQRQQADMFYQNQMQQYGAERPVAPQQGMGNMTEAEHQILMNQLFNQNAQQSQADAFRNARPEMGLLQMYGAGR
jgi:hypothetical protein